MTHSGHTFLRRLFSGTAQDLRFTLSSLRHRPLFTLAVVLIASLGVSITILAFTVVNAAFLRPLPHIRAPEALTTLENVTENALLEERVFAALLGGFSLLALVLAALELYGVMSYTVMARTAELGIRLALGASPRDVVRMILADSVKVAAWGIGVGLCLAVVTCIGSRALLVWGGAVDPLSLRGSAAVLTMATLLAGLAPALRAARLDPVVSPRSE